MFFIFSLHKNLNLDIYFRGKYNLRQKTFLKITIQLFSEKCTGRYFKVRDDDLSSKQGSLCSFKMILKIIRKYFKVYIYIYLYLSCHDWWDRFSGNFLIDRYFRILCSTRTWRLRYTFLKYPVCEISQLTQLL